jgi:co-chaperonin GroES (HSP10)
MLKAEWIDQISPASMRLFVERDEQPKTYGTFIIIPDRYRQGTRTHLGTVHSTGFGVRHVHKGDRVVISSGVGRKIVFGDRALYVCFESEMLAKVTGEKLEDLGEAKEGRFPVEHPMGDEIVADEGTVWGKEG